MSAKRTRNLWSCTRIFTPSICLYGANSFYLLQHHIKFYLRVVKVKYATLVQPCLRLMKGRPGLGER